MTKNPAEGRGAAPATELESRPPAAGPAASARELALRAELMYLRLELRALLDELGRLGAESTPMRSAVVTAVVPKTKLARSS